MTSDRKLVSTAPTPGFGWQERYLDGSALAEAAFIRRALADINEVQRRNKKKGKAKGYDRAFHAKMHAGIDNAQLVVSSELPPALQVGFLQPGAVYPASVRLSNASGVVQPDTAKDLRGLAVRVATANGAHDFLATNGAASHARNARQFIDFALASSGSKLLLLPRLLYNIGLCETIRMFRTVIGQVKRPVASLALESYFSRSAYAFGPVAVQFRFAPAQSSPVIVKKTDDYLRDDLVARLKMGPVSFDLQVQLFLDEKRTPIEDGSVQWPSELLTIARLVIPQQDLNSQSAQSAHASVQALEFTPWNTTAPFRPLGSLNRARRLVYKASTRLRSENPAKGN